MAALNLITSANPNLGELVSSFITTPRSFQLEHSCRSSAFLRFLSSTPIAHSCRPLRSFSSTFIQRTVMLLQHKKKLDISVCITNPPLIPGSSALQSQESCGGPRSSARAFTLLQTFADSSCTYRHCRRRSESSSVCTGSCPLTRTPS